jgi:hypothetical protein
MTTSKRGRSTRTTNHAEQSGELIISWTRSIYSASRYSQFALSSIARAFSVLGCNQLRRMDAEQGELLLTHTNCTTTWSPTEQGDSQPPMARPTTIQVTIRIFLDSFVLCCLSIDQVGPFHVRISKFASSMYGLLYSQTKALVPIELVQHEFVLEMYVKCEASAIVGRRGTHGAGKARYERSVRRIPP